MADINTSTIETALHDDLSSFLGEVRANADLLVAAALNETYEINSETLLGIMDALYNKSGELKKRLDGGAS